MGVYIANANITCNSKIKHLLLVYENFLTTLKNFRFLQSNLTKWHALQKTKYMFIT